MPGLPSVVKEKNPPWVVEFLRRRLMHHLTPPENLRPLYVTRTAGTHNRTVINETELIRLLTTRGFDVIDPAADERDRADGGVRVGVGDRVRRTARRWPTWSSPARVRP